MPSDQSTSLASPGRCLPARRARLSRPARWWLAGLLVGCLLPTGLAPAEGLRQAERIAQMWVLAPALIRASSRLQARRRALASWPSRPPERHRAIRRPRATVLRRASAAHDVLTRRGPPAWAS